MRLRILPGLLFLLILVASSPAALAHKPQVIQVNIEQLDERTFVLRYQIPLGGRALYPIPFLPESCDWVEPPKLREGPVRLFFRAVDRPLSAEDVLFLDWPRKGVLVSMVWQSGVTSREYFPRRNQEIAVDFASLQAGSGTFRGTMRRYFPLGFGHLLRGAEHLAFLAGLLLLVEGWRRLFFTLLAFALAHCLTLVLSLVEVFRFREEMVDPLLGLSVVILAVELADRQRGRMTWSSRRPWLLSFGFGLLHGLAMATALDRLGLTNESILQVLVGFHLGVETGQILVVAVWLVVRQFLRGVFPNVPAWIAAVPVWLLGTAGAVWFFEGM